MAVVTQPDVHASVAQTPQGYRWSVLAGPVNWQGVAASRELAWASVRVILRGVLAWRRESARFART